MRRQPTLGAILVCGMLSVVATDPALAASVSSGGPWTYTTGPITCQFSGSHYSADAKATGQTSDYNGGCARLAVRIKFSRASDEAVITGSWKTVNTSILIVTADVLSTAIASEHKAENGYYPSWSPVQRPHAF